MGLRWSGPNQEHKPDQELLDMSKGHKRKYFVDSNHNLHKYLKEPILVGFQFKKKLDNNSYLGDFSESRFWGDKSRGKKFFSILTGSLVKIGGQKLIFESYQYW